MLSDDTIRLLIGEKWLDAAPIVSALVLSSYLTSLGQYNFSVFLVSGKPQWEAVLNLANTVMNVLLYVLVARYGAVMIALAFSLRALVLYPLSLVPAAACWACRRWTMSGGLPRPSWLRSAWA